MKSRRYAVAALIVAGLAVAAWSPPSNEDVIIGGNDNTVLTPTGAALVVGNTNTLVGRATTVTGINNMLAVGGTNAGTSLSFSIVGGSSNTVHQGAEGVLVAGNTNTLRGDYSFVAGQSNTVRGAGVNDETFRSAAIGWGNEVFSPSGWALGHGNSVTGNRGVAIGTNMLAGNQDSIAIGRNNAAMQSNDVFVVGSGGATGARRNSIRVTSDSGVVLGHSSTGRVTLARAQGDISMGEYSN